MLICTRGTCKYGISGNQCRYRHPKICKKLASHGTQGENGCTLGKRCSMFHPIVCKNSLKKNECLIQTCKFLHIKGTRRIKETSQPPQFTPPTATVNFQSKNGSPQRKDINQPRNGPQHQKVQHEDAPPYILKASDQDQLLGMRQDLAHLIRIIESQTMLSNSLLQDKVRSQGQTA